MDTAMENRPGAAIGVLLAGLQAGTVGTLWMLAWMGLSASWKHLSFWTFENLLATSFYGNGALEPGFGTHTVSGMALAIAIYTALGAAFAVAAGRRRMSRLRLLLLGMLFGVCWYYLSFRLLWKGVVPLVAMLHPVQPTLVGHLIYGAAIGRFPAYMRQAGQAAPAGTAGEPAPAAEEPKAPR